MVYVEIYKDLLTSETPPTEDKILETFTDKTAELELCDPESSDDEEVDEPVSKADIINYMGKLQRYVVDNVSKKQILFF